MTHLQGNATQGRAGKEGTTNLSVCRLTRARRSPAADAHARRARWRRVAALAVALTWWAILAATPVQAEDSHDGQGNDDDSGHRDLTECHSGGTCNGSGVSVSWNFDDTNWTGTNTGDACALFDTDGDGNANRAVCVTVQGAAQMQAGNPKCYTCGDTRPDRCTSAVLTPCTSTCQVTLDSDPFQFAPFHLGKRCSGTNCRTEDTKITCCVTSGDRGGSGGVLMDACSYPNHHPDDDSNDCVTDRGCPGHGGDDDEHACDDHNPCTVDSCDPTCGRCRHVAGNQGAQCRAPAGVCDAPEFCDGTHISCPADHFKQSGICRNASDVCDVAESCNGTSANCPADGVKAQGTLCRTSTGQCDVAEVCNGSSKACPPDGSQPNSTPCNDGDACTTNDVCTNGQCGGTTKNCNDNNACTDDGCNPASGCTHVNNNDPCNDGNACTTNDACAGGGCVGGAPPNCNDHDVCTTDSCNTATGCVHTNNTAPCDDGNACTGPDTCSNDTCTGAPISCNDGNACTTDGCDPATGCTHAGVPGCCNFDSECTDTDQCTTNNHCVNHACVSDPVNCNDNNACTDDDCNPASGCTHVNNNDPCNDGNACTTNDACAGGGCVGGAAPNCNDHDVCTTDSCNMATGCVHTNNTAPCDDGNACTGPDTCNGNDSCTGAIITCNDGNGCTTDSCNTATGCVYINNTAPCSDGNPCTEGDICADGGCTSGTEKDCNDIDPCTDDDCNPQTGACEHLNNSAPCDDGDVCTDGDHCVNDSCTGAFPKDCGDGNVCTTDTCTPTTDCQHSPVAGCCNIDADCADTDGCTINERCVNHNCVHDPRTCADDDDCSIDTCNNDGGDFLCVNTPCFEIDPALCPNPACIPPLCGNHHLDPGETCDPPDPTPLPGVTPLEPTCRDDCTFCGDGVIDAEFGEICDDGTTAVGCTRRGFPVDPNRCQNNCTPPVCKDPTMVQLAANIDKYNFHGRLAVGSPVDFLTHDFTVELTDPAGRVLYRASLPAGSLVSTSGNPAGPFTYVNVDKQAKISGGMYKIKILNQVQKSNFYRASVLSYGNLLVSQADMVQHVYGGGAEWTALGTWVRKSPSTWKFVQSPN